MMFSRSVLKTAWYWHKNEQKDQWNQIEDPDINPHTYKHLIFDKDTKNVKWKNESLTNGSGLTGSQYVEE